MKKDVLNKCDRNSKNKKVITTKENDLFKASIFRCDEIHSFFCGFLREDFALLFYFSSYSLFFFLFYKFNAKFKESFVDIMVKLKLMKKKTKVIELFKLEI